MTGGVVAHVTSYVDNGHVVFIETTGASPADCEWEIEYRPDGGEWTASSCVARSIPGRDILLRFFAAIHPDVRAVAVVSERRAA